MKNSLACKGKMSHNIMTSFLKSTFSKEHIDMLLGSEYRGNNCLLENCQHHSPKYKLAGKEITDNLCKSLQQSKH